MKKIRLMMGIIVFVLLATVSLSNINASEVEEPLTNFITDEQFATYLVENQEGFNTLSGINDTLTESEFQQYAASVTEIKINGPNYYFGSYDIKSFEGLDSFSNIKFLTLNNFNFTTPPAEIAELSNLETLELRYNKLIDVNGLNNLSNLKLLKLKDNNIETIDPLEKLINLQGLELNYNNIENIDSLEKLINLQVLELNYNNIENIEPLSNLTALTDLTFSNNKVQNVDAVQNMDKLVYLEFNDNKVQNIDSLKNLTELGELYIAENQLENIDFVEDLTKLHTLYMYSNNVIDFRVLKTLSETTTITGDLTLYAGGQKYTTYLPYSVDGYPELFALINCPELSEQCSDLENDYLIDNGQYTSIITNSDSDEITYNVGVGGGTIEFLSDFDIDVTIIPVENIVAHNFETDISTAADSEEKIIDQLNASVKTTSGKDISENISITDFGGYDINDPQIGTYQITLSLDLISTEFNTTVTYVVYTDPLLEVEDKTLYYSDATSSQQELLEQLNISLIDEYENSQPDDYIEKLVVENYEDLKIGENFVTITYVGDYKITTSTTFNLTLLIDPSVEMSDYEVTLSNAPTTEVELLEVLSVLINGQINGEDILELDGYELILGGYELDNPQVGSYDVAVFYTDELGTTFTTSTLSVIDDSDSEQEDDVKETGYEYNVISLYSLITIIGVLILKKIK